MKTASTVLIALALGIVAPLVAFGAKDEVPAAAQAEMKLGQEAFEKKDWPAVLQHYQKAAEIAPRSLAVQQRYISMHRFVTLTTMKHDAAEKKQFALAEKYKAMARREPRNAIWQLLIGAALYYEDPVQSERAYQRALKIDPKNTEALTSLGTIATTRGDEETSRAYYLEAAQVEPDNPQLLGTWVGSFMNTDPARFREEAMKLIERFPDSPDAAKWFYWLGTKSADPVEKRAYWKQAMDRFPLESLNEDQIGWLGSVYSAYFESLQADDPVAAEAFALETMRRLNGKKAEKSWFHRYRRQSDLNEVRAAREAEDYTAALEIVTNLEKFVPPRERVREQIAYEKALAQSGSGDHAAALETLVSLLREGANPVAEAAYFSVAAKAGKSEKEADELLWKARLAEAKEFKDFTLNDPDGNPVKLSSLRGQVVLVNFWYPSCGPCRGEFPHLENIVQRFAGKPFRVLALNTHPRENDKVKPFLQKNGYHFQALQTPGEEWTKETYGVIGTPANFLLDQQGRIVAQPRLHDHETEQRLSVLIEQLLNRGT